jgi:hypothetical protein
MIATLRIRVLEISGKLPICFGSGKKVIWFSIVIPSISGVANELIIMIALQRCRKKGQNYSPKALD